MSRPSRNEDIIRMRHMLDAAKEAVHFASGKSKEYFEHDRMLQLALIQCVQVIGEAAARTTDEAKTQAADIPWRQIVGMRNILVHAYSVHIARRFWMGRPLTIPVPVADNPPTCL